MSSSPLCPFLGAVSSDNSNTRKEKRGLLLQENEHKGENVFAEEKQSLKLLALLLGFLSCSLSGKAAADFL